MEADEVDLLDGVLTGLDRLFDGQCGPEDVLALVVATAAALRGTPHQTELVRPVADLRATVQSGRSAEVQRDLALGITDDLRLYLAGLPPFAPPPGRG